MQFQNGTMPECAPATHSDGKNSDYINRNANRSILRADSELFLDMFPNFMTVVDIPIHILTTVSIGLRRLHLNTVCKRLRSSKLAELKMCLGTVMFVEAANMVHFRH